MKIISIIVAFIGLFFSFTNFIPISATPVILIFFIPFFILGRNRFNYIFISLFFMLSYFFISGLLYSPEAFFEYEFYRRDGNVFVTFSFLLTLVLFRYKLNINMVFDYFLYATTVINFCCLIMHFTIGNSLYKFFFIGHNAAGGFLMMLTAISLSKLLSKHSVTNFLIFSINLVGLLATDSRGSIIGLFSAMVMLFAYKKGYEKKGIAIFFVLQLLLYSFLYINAPSGFLSYAYNTYDKSLSYNDWDLSRLSTVIIRGFYLWPLAIYLFLKSPILGTGFGSYNDVPYDLVGKDNFFMYNDGTVYFDDHHAHNTYLHVLAENGIIGLILLIFFIYSCNQYIKTIHEKYVFNSLYLCLWCAIFSSVTEHRFFTPSQMLPFSILLGLSHIASNYRSKICYQIKSNISCRDYK